MNKEEIAQRILSQGNKPEGDINHKIALMSHQLNEAIIVLNKLQIGIRDKLNEMEKRIIERIEKSQTQP